MKMVSKKEMMLPRRLMKLPPPMPPDLKTMQSTNTHRPELDQNFNEFEGKSSNLCEGYLYIQSKSVWKFPNQLWKWRYFTLRKDVLYFTKNRGDLIFEESTPCIEIEADTGIYPEETESKGKKRYLIRICKGKSTHVLCSEKEEDRNTFLACLLTVITQKYVANFKCGFYKSVRLNYKPKQKSQQRHSSFLPKRPTEEDVVMKNVPLSRIEEHGSLVMTKAESLFNISPTSKEFSHSDRTSFVAL